VVSTVQYLHPKKPSNADLHISDSKLIVVLKAWGILFYCPTLPAGYVATSDIPTVT
jgi:hypothetical protein